MASKPIASEVEVAAGAELVSSEEASADEAALEAEELSPAVEASSPLLHPDAAAITVQAARPQKILYQIEVVRLVMFLSILSKLCRRISDFPVFHQFSIGSARLFHVPGPLPNIAAGWGECNRRFQHGVCQNCPAGCAICSAICQKGFCRVFLKKFSKRQICNWKITCPLRFFFGSGVEIIPAVG